jgi:Ca2+ transporting ATPase
MGGANNICSDKTGTLTKNLMTVTKIFIEQGISNSIEADIARDHTIRMLCLSICTNTSANPTITRQGGEITNSQVGNKTECALLEMSFRMGYDYKKFRTRENMLKVFPFSSAKKKMATVYTDEKKTIYVFVKGAPDFLLESCTKYINKNGTINKINSDFLEETRSVL